jgi:hypothetical protein
MPLFMQPLIFQDSFSNDFNLNSLNFSNIYLYPFSFLSDISLLNIDKVEKESIFSRSENIFFLLLPLLYFYLSNMVKLSQILQNGFVSDSFSTIENRYIWGSIFAISINIIIHDIFL